VIKRKHTRKATIKMLPDLNVQITIPQFFKDSDLEKIIQDNHFWLFEKRKRFVQTYPELMIQRHFKNGEMYRFLGQDYTIKIEISNTEEVRIEQNYIVLSVKEDYYTRKESLMAKWLGQQSTFILNETFQGLFQVFKSNKVVLPTLRLKNCKTIWGSCNHKKNTIALNRKLIHLPIELIQYVVYHELVHLNHPNHGKEFYKELSFYVGDYKQFKEMIKKYSIYYV
jgi:predicted metal-dependent hydrolase